MTPGKVLALDWGDVRCGWALSDASRTLAARHGVYERHDPETDLAFFAALAAREGVSAAVIGIPFNMDGSLGPQAQRTLEAKAALERALGLTVHEVDERLTSAEAERVLLEGGLSRERRRALRDGLAATLILQTYLDRQRP